MVVRKSDLVADPMVGCMTDCKIDRMVGCRGQVPGYNFGMKAAGAVADTGFVDLLVISVADSQVTEHAVAVVHTGLDSGCHGLRAWSRPRPKGCDQPFCEWDLVVYSVQKIEHLECCCQLVSGHVRLDRLKVVL